MFFRRYLRIGEDESSEPDTPEPTQDNQPNSETTLTPRTRAVIELIAMQRSMDLSTNRTGVVIESGNDSEFADAYEDSNEDENPSASALSAVRMCVWSFFLFGFLILFQAQQNSMNSQRLQQANRLRMPQLIHMQIPWADFSGINQGTSSLTAQYIDSNKTTYSVSRVNSGEVCLTVKQDVGNFIDIQPVKGETPTELKSNNLISLHSLSNGHFVTLAKSTSGDYELKTPLSQTTLSVHGDIVFSSYRSAETRLHLVTRSSESSSDCMMTYIAPPNESKMACETAFPILQSNAYFMDDISGNLVCVGTDDITTDNGGHGVHGVFVRSLRPMDGSIDFSISLPFLHRYDEGIWVFQNNPLSQGFVVLLPTLGYPPTPMQHVVAIRQGTADYPKGTVFRLENPDMSLFRKVDTVPFNPPWVPAGPSGCSCTS